MNNAALTFAEVNNLSHDFLTCRDRATELCRALHTPIFPLLPEVLGRIFLINTQRNARTDTIQKTPQDLRVKSVIPANRSPWPGRPLESCCELFRSIFKVDRGGLAEVWGVAHRCWG